MEPLNERNAPVLEGQNPSTEPFSAAVEIATIAALLTAAFQRNRIATQRFLGHKAARLTAHIMWFGPKRNPEEHRYYLLPGQGRSNRRVRRQQLIAALIAGAIFAGMIAGIMWFLNDVR